MRETREGWWWPFNSRKAHYMVNGRSLCGKWACLGHANLEPGEGGGPDDCKPCAREAAKRLE